MQLSVTGRVKSCDLDGTQGQNIPRAFGVKRCFNTRPGYCVVYADFSSAEVKLLANQCKDERMLKAVHDGLDFHTYSASAIHGIPYDDFHAVIEDRKHEKHKEYKALRQGAKATTFGIDLRYHSIVM